MVIQDIRQKVQERYGNIAKESSSCCSPKANSNSCCGSSTSKDDISQSIGYSIEELKSIPVDANLGLGCGNPVALASLKEGETVLDLGSGAGIDCFLSANKVGAKGKVIGVDMTQEMIFRARENAAKGKYENVEFRLGEIENLPVADSSVDVVISNCVVNLSPDKKRVFSETFRVLKPGGRLMVSDIVIDGTLPEAVRKSVEAYISCVGGALSKDDYLDSIKAAGFTNVKIASESKVSPEVIGDFSVEEIISKISDADKEKTIGSIVSIKVSAEKKK